MITNTRGLTESLTYDDIGLVPRQPSEQASRSDCDTTANFLGRNMDMPIIVAPMKTVVSDQLRQFLAGKNQFTLAHRGAHTYDCGGIHGWPSIGLEDDIESLGFWKYVLIDVANGFHTAVAKKIRQIKAVNPAIKIITGNVASLEGYKFLAEAGADAVRVGVGSGSACLTSINTGIGVGQASLVREIAYYKYFTHGVPKSCPTIIADGGIKNAGHIVKAIALGADVVMIGGLFAAVKESGAETVTDPDGNAFKLFAGEASAEAKGNNRHVEGVQKMVRCTGSVKDLWQTLKEGLQSGMAYMNCNTLEQLRFLKDNNFVGLSSNTWKEKQA